MTKMPHRTIDLLPRQSEAWQLLEDDTTTELLYGGAAGGAKTFLGCAWQIIRRLQYPGTRGVIGRARLKNLRLTTLNTFFSVAGALQLQPGTHYRYRQQDGIIHWRNGSETLLKDLSHHPSDPEYTTLGSLEITDAFIDEANEVSEKAASILSSRMRWRLQELGLAPKLLLSCNPSKGWLYTQFYKPWRAGTLPGHRRFVQSLLGDNPYLTRLYRDQLARLDDISRERLLYGNWEYDSAEGALLPYATIADLFTNSFVPPGEACITADVARLGSDRAVIIRWEGFRAQEVVAIDRSLLTTLAERIGNMAQQRRIPRSHIVADEDGVGGGLVDMLQCRGFTNNASALNGENYRNLKAQCAFRFASRAARGELYISPATPFRSLISEELGALRRDMQSEDGRIALQPKRRIREAIGRSPDFADALIMREYFELLPKRGLVW